MIVDNENVVQSEILFSHKERENYEIKCMNVKYMELGENTTDWGKSGQEGEVPHNLSNRNPNLKSLVSCGVHGISVEMGYPIKVSIAVTKHRNPMQREEENNLFQVTVPNNSSSLKGRNSKTEWTWRQELKQKPWRNAAYWLAPNAWFSLLSYSNEDNQPKCGMPTVIWDISHKLLIEKVLSRLAHKPIYWGHILM